MRKPISLVFLIILITILTINSFVTPVSAQDITSTPIVQVTLTKTPVSEAEVV